MNSPNPYAPPRGAVADIADDSAGLELASRMTRLGAAMLDGVVAGVMIYLPFAIGVAVSGAFSIPATNNPQEVQAAVNAAMLGALFGMAGLLGLVGCIAWLWIMLHLVIRYRQTIGKRMVGIKVVRRDGSQVSLSRLFWLRNVVNGVLGVIPGYGLVDLLLIFGSNRQCIHDKLADTIVVRA